MSVILLTDGTSKLLLTDGSSKLLVTEADHISTILLETGDKVLLEVNDARVDVSGNERITVDGDLRVSINDVTTDALLNEGGTVVPNGSGGVAFAVCSLDGSGSSVGHIRLSSYPVVVIGQGGGTARLSNYPIVVIQFGSSGSITFGAPSLQGNAGLGVDGSGDISFGVPSLQGDGGEFTPGTGGVSFSLSLDGVGTQSFSATGAISFGAPSLDGTAFENFRFSGGVVFQKPVMSGTGIVTFTGSGGVVFGFSLDGKGPGPLAPVRVTQEVLEGVDINFPQVLVTQQVLENVTAFFSDTRVTQQVLEVIAWGHLLPLDISCPSNLFVRDGVFYDDFAVATGGKRPYHFDIIAGHLPGGLVLDADTGEISGIPTSTPGAISFTVRVTDKFLHTAQHTCTLYVAPTEVVNPARWNAYRFDTKIRPEEKA